MAMRQPFVGITGYHVRGEEGFGGLIRGNVGQGFSMVGHDYIQSVVRAGGVPLGLPVVPEDLVPGLVSVLDAVLVTGGEDVDPRRYGDYPDPRVGLLSPERDAFELKVIEQALLQRKPVLAICRGLQVMNVYFGGTLYRDTLDYEQDAREHGLNQEVRVLTHQFEKVPRWYKAHHIALYGEVLPQLYGSDSIEVNSFHHQTVKMLGEALDVAARSSDGVIEAFTHPGYPQLLAVQWHPEMMAVTLDEGLVPFRWLIGAATN